MRAGEFTDETIEGILADISRQGYAMVEDFLAPSQVTRAREFANEAVRVRSGEYVAFVGADAVANSGLDELGQSAELRRIMERLYEKGFGRKAPEQDVYQVLRCLAGKMGQDPINSYFFHYDSEIVTILIPIEIPTEGQPGEFLLFPHTRKIHDHKVRFWDTVARRFVMNPVTQRVLRFVAVRGRLFTRIRLVPGNAYFFWGGLSVHANAPCDVDRLRATALFHFANPHLGLPVLPIPRTISRLAHTS